MNRPSGRGRTLAAALIAAAVLLTRLLPAAAQELAKEPVFALNTPYHAGFVLRLAVTPDERQVVTAGFDKTVRVWDARTGELLRRHFLPVRDAADGRVTAAALSPDGERLALGGGLHGFGKGKAVIVVSLADGRIADVVGVFNLSARTVSWSRDGALLAVGMDGHEGPSRIHVFETATWSKVFEDRQVRGRVDAIEFRRDGAFVAVTNNGTIDSEAFLYRPAGKTFQRVAKKSFGVRGAMRAAWTAAETHLYVGGHSYLSGDELAESAWPAGGRPPPAAEGFSVLRESPDGARVYAAFWGRNAEAGKLRRYRDRSLRDYDEIPIPDARVTDFAVLRDGTLIYVSHEGALAAIGPDFKPLWRQAAALPWFRGAPERLKVSADGRWVTLPAGANAREVAFDLYEPRFAHPANASDRWIEPLTGRPAVRLLGWKGSYKGTVNGNPLPRFHGRETALSAVVHPAESAFAYGSNLGRLRKVAADGRPLWMRVLPADVTALQLIEPAGLLVVATEDGFLRVMRWADGVTVLSYYLQPAQHKWVAVSAGGYYEAGAGAEDLAGWIVNRDQRQMADFYPLSRFRERLLLPGLARAALDARDGTLGAQRALEVRAKASAATGEEAAARIEAMRRSELAQRAEASRADRLPDGGDPYAADAEPTAEQPVGPPAMRLPPVVDILSPGPAATVSVPKLALRLRVRTPPDAPVTALATRIVSAGQISRGLPSLSAVDEIDLTLDLPAEDAEVQIVAANRWGSSVPARVRVRYAGKPPATPPGKGTLHVLAIGVSDYDNAGYRLGLAAKDARDFGLLMAGQQGRRYDEVEATVLADKAAGKESVERALSSLRAKVRAQDTTFVFLAGHGINDEAGEYLYLPREADLERLGETAVSFRLLRQILTSLPGRTLLFVDTCHAGNALGTLRPGLTRDNTVAINELASAENNIIVFASSTGAQESMEDVAWGNGAFTKALIEGLKGAADFKRRGRVTYKQLDAYVADRVEELTKGRQTPVTPALFSVPDFVLAETGP